MGIQCDFKCRLWSKRAPPVGKEALVANADITVPGCTWSRKRRKNSVTEIVRVRFLLPWAELAPAKGDLVLVERDQAVVGNGDAMGVAAEVLGERVRDLRRVVCSRRPIDDGTVAAGMQQKPWGQSGASVFHGGTPVGVWRKRALAV